MTNRWRSSSDPIITSDLTRSRELDDDLVLYHSGTDQVSHFDPVARAVWEQLQARPTFAELVRALAQQFNEDEARVSADVSALLDEMIVARLIETTPSSPDVD